MGLILCTDAPETREALPRRAEVPFDSEYKFMATFHDRPDWFNGGIIQQPHFMSVKGARGALWPGTVALRAGANRHRPRRDPGRQPPAL
jgi:magnesium-transporting ATPase (P-type)